MKASMTMSGGLNEQAYRYECFCGAGVNVSDTCKTCKGEGYILIDMNYAWTTERDIAEGRGVPPREQECLDCGGLGTISPLKNTMNEIQKTPMPAKPTGLQ